MDFEEKVAEQESEIKDKVDKVGEVIETATPTEVAAMLELADENEEKESTPDGSEEDKTTGQGETKSPETTSEEKAEKETKVTEPEKKEEPEKVKSPGEPKGTITITDEYINAAEEKDRNILKGLKGETFSPKGLQVIIDSQRKIGEQGNELGQLRKLTNNDNQPRKSIPDDNDIPEQQLTNEIQKLKAQEVDRRLRAHFNDLPEDPQEAKEYLAMLNQSDPEAFLDYRDMKRSVQKQVDGEFNKAIYVQNNQLEINTHLLSAEIDGIAEELKDWGIEDAKKLGFDFTISQDAEGRSNNELLRELIYPDGKMDNNLFNFVGRTPIFKEGALLDKFFRTKGKLVREALKKQIGIDAKKEAYNELSEKKEINTNTSSVQKGAGASTFAGAKKAKPIEELSPTELAAVLKDA